MRLQNITFFVLFFSILTSTNAFAQVVVLTCKSKLTKEYLDEFPKFWEGQCIKYAGTDCDRAQEARDQVKLCVESKLPYSHKREYTFDKKALSDRNESWAEIVNQTCWGSNDLSRNKITATASVISFTQDKSTFNVDRATLNGGWRELRDWQCDVKEKILKNKI